MNQQQSATIRIGIPVPTWADAEYNHRCWPQYAEAVRTAGGEPVSLALGLQMEQLAQVADGCDGYVLPGSPADVDPERYGAARNPASAPADPHREQCDEALLAHAAVQGKPVLAICFGMQILNVWSGGSLVQDLAPIPVNHAAGTAVETAHSVQVEEESLLAGLLSRQEVRLKGTQRLLGVNSSHHQAVETAGESLAVVARSAEDGVIEAMEGRVGAAAMLAVQWHPERSTATSAASRAMFLWLVSEAEDRRQTITLEGSDEQHV